MKTIKSDIRKVGLVALLAVAGQVSAAEGTSKYVEEVDLTFPGLAAVINIENQSANKTLPSLDLKVTTNAMNFDVSSSSVECKGTNVKFIGASAKFGPVSIINDGKHINSSSTLYSQSDIDVAYFDSDNKLTEAGYDIFTVPVNSVKNGHPALRVDALEELNKKLQTHLQGGGKALDFYKQDQEIVLQRPISLTGACGKKNNANKSSVGYHTRNHTIQIKYKGDPGLTNPPVLNAQLGNNMPNQFQAGEQSFKVHDAGFMANIPHHIGKCIPDQNPVIRVNYHMIGDEQGVMDFRINSYSNQYADYGVYYEHLGVVKNPKLAGNHSHFDFEFPLKEMLSQQKYSWMVTLNNKTYNHNMVLQVRYKSHFGEMTQWQDMDTATFKHRCVPQLNGQIDEQDGIQGYDNGGPKPPVVNGTIQAKPMPKPPLGKAVITPKPAPKPMGIRAPIESEPTSRPARQLP